VRKGGKDITLAKTFTKRKGKKDGAFTKKGERRKTGFGHRGKKKKKKRTPVLLFPQGKEKQKKKKKSTEAKRCP